MLGEVLRDDASLHELFLALGGQSLILRAAGVPSELRFGLLEQRLVARLVGLRLLEGRFEGPRVDLEEQIAFLDDLALGKKRLVDLAGDLRPQGNRGVRFDVSDRGDNDKRTSYLMVSKISPTESCVVGIVKPGKNQNAEARRLADSAANKPCKKAE